MLDLPEEPVIINEVKEVAEATVSTEKVTESYVVTDDVQMPICTVDFKNVNIEAINANVEVGPGTYHNSYYGSSWIMHFPGESYIKINTTIEHVDNTKKYVLDLNHLSSVVEHSMDSPISIFVNGQSVVNGHNPNNAGYVHQEFEVSSFLVEGNNSIEIRFDNGARTNYWIQSLAIVQH